MQVASDHIPPRRSARLGSICAAATEVSSAPPELALSPCTSSGDDIESAHNVDIDAVRPVSDIEAAAAAASEHRQSYVLGESTIQTDAPHVDLPTNMTATITDRREDYHFYRNDNENEDMPIGEAEDDYLLSQENLSEGRNSSCDERFQDTDDGSSDDGGLAEDCSWPPELLHNSSTQQSTHHSKVRRRRRETGSLGPIELQHGGNAFEMSAGAGLGEDNAATALWGLVQMNDAEEGAHADGAVDTWRGTATSGGGEFQMPNDFTSLPFQSPPVGRTPTGVQRGYENQALPLEVLILLVGNVIQMTRTCLVQ